MSRAEARNKLLTDGLKVGNHHNNLRYRAVRYFPVTVIGLPPDMSTEDFVDEMSKYGTLLKHYDVFKLVGGQRVRNGNRVYHYKELDDTIPMKIISDDCVVHLMYNKNVSKEFCSDFYWDKLMKFNPHVNIPVYRKAQIH